MWMAWRFVTDGGDYDEDVMPRAVGIVLVLSGMLFFALLVGLIGESIEAYIASLKQGKGRVLETGHTLVLGWSDKLLPFLREIAQANQSEGGGVVVVLSDQHSKEEMDELIGSELSATELLGTRVVCRHGNPMATSSLNKVGAPDARAIVLLAQERVAPDESDARAVRAVLALKAGLPSLRGHVVVELRDVDNLPLLNLHAATRKGHDGMTDAAVVPVVCHDIIGRLMIQCSRQPHLADVYDHLIGFSGMEFYVKREPSLVGHAWEAVLVAFEDACPIGLMQGGSRLRLNPPDDYELRADDEVIVIAEDNDTYMATVPAEIGFVGPPPVWSVPPKAADNVLLCGWRRDLLDMLLELDKYVSSGCVVTILAPVPVDDRTALLEAGKSRKLELSHLVLEHVEGSTIHRADLERLLRARSYASVLVLSAESDDDTGTSDSKNLTTLLLVRDIRRSLAREAAEAAEELAMLQVKQEAEEEEEEKEEEEGGAEGEKKEEEEKPEEGGAGTASGMELDSEADRAKFEHVAPGDRVLVPSLGESYVTVESRRGGQLCVVHSSGIKVKVALKEVSEVVRDPNSPIVQLEAETAAKKRALASRAALQRERQSSRVAKQPASAAAPGASKPASSVHGDGEDDGLSLLGEILDSETRDLVVSAGISADHIMSNQLLSRVLAMVAESVVVGPLLDMLFSEEGDDIYVRDARFYAREGEWLSFWQVGVRARGLGDVAIGYKRNGELVLNPPRKQQPLEWLAGDFLIVIGDSH